jgi:hypothetical protein
MTTGTALLWLGGILLVFAALAGLAEWLERRGVDGYALCRRMGLGSHLYPERERPAGGYSRKQIEAAAWGDLQAPLRRIVGPYDHERDGL